jgi:P27 family predicted phage terminase small subunit
MGKGRPPKDTATLKAQGTYRDDRHAKRLEVKPVDAMPPAPDDFNEEHSAKWAEVCGLLFRAGILSEQDGHAIRTYVENTILARRAWEALSRDGMVIMVETKQGEKAVTNPWFRVYQDCQKILKPLMEQFGFTPRARMGLKLDAETHQKTSKVLSLVGGVKARTA